MNDQNEEPVGFLDAAVRLFLVLALFGWNTFEALSLRTPYPSTMVALWSIPLWRMLLLFTLWLGAEWSPQVGTLTAVAVLFYTVNMIQII
jgi:hypothetical protein